MNLWWSKLVNLLLACYPRTWRDRFADQVRADLEDAHADHVAGANPLLAWHHVAGANPLLAWLCLTVWDLVRGVARAHLAPVKVEHVALATTGGSVGGFDASPPDVCQAMLSAARQLPFFVVVGTMMFAGAGLLGLGVYDLDRFIGHALVGLVLVGVFGRLLYHRVEKALTIESNSHTDEFAKNIQLIAFAILFCLFCMGFYDFVSDRARGSGVTLAQSFHGVVGIPGAFIVSLVICVLLTSIVGSLATSVSPPPRAIVALMFAAMAVGIYLAVLHGAMSFPAALVMASPVAVILISNWRRQPSPKWVRVSGFVLMLLSMPVLLGFIFGVVLDTSYTREQAQGEMGVGISPAPTLREQAQDYYNAIQAVQDGGDHEGFWSYVQVAESQRQAWQQHKVWVSLFTAKPVGISSRDWCLASHGGTPLSRVAYCAQIADGDEWLTRMPQHKHAP